jgi:hypothetical protein
MMRYFILLGICGLACFPGTADAGMPSITYTISEVSRMRIETISFFLAGFFLSALCIKWLWNYLAGEFTVLPRLSYGRALALLTLWGLLFVLVLTMISGARELMTPGAWEKDGTTHKLKQAPNSEAYP